MERLSIIDEAAYSTKSSVAYKLNQDRYASLSLSLFPNRDPWPASSLIVRIFLVLAYFRNNQSAKSFPNYLTHIKAGHLQRGYVWFTEAQMRPITLTSRALTRSQPNKVIHRKTPVTLSVIDRCDICGRSSILALEFSALCRTAHNGLLRGAEFRTLLFSQLEWTSDRSKLLIRIVNSKANKAGPPEVIDLRDWGPGSAVAALRLYFDAYSLWKLSYSERPVFPHFQRSTDVSALLMRLTQLAGIQGDFACHSFRSGGACDLYSANVPIESVMKAGRWKSDAVRLYLRDTVVTGIKIAHAFRFSHDHGFDFWGNNTTS